MAIRTPGLGRVAGEAQAARGEGKGCLAARERRGGGCYLQQEKSLGGGSNGKIS